MKTRKPQTWRVWLGVIFLVGALGWIDWTTPYELNFFAFYFLPVGLAAWFLGSNAALLLGWLSALVWFEANAGQPYSSPLFAAWNTAIRLVSFLAFGWTLARLKQSRDHDRDLAVELNKSLSEIKVLEAFLPICAQCKKIRDKQGVWHPLEAYIGQHSNTVFSHGYCPECARRVLAQADMTAG